MPPLETLTGYAWQAFMLLADDPRWASAGALACFAFIFRRYNAFTPWAAASIYVLGCIKLGLGFSVVEQQVAISMAACTAVCIMLARESTNYKPVTMAVWFAAGLTAYLAGRPVPVIVPWPVLVAFGVPMLLLWRLPNVYENVLNNRRCFLGGYHEDV